MSTERWSLWRAGPLLLLLASLASPAFSQVVTATVTGTVADNTGAAVAGASVVATSQKTRVEYPTLSNEAGVYTITGLPLGSYVVRAELTGFKAIATNPFTLESGQTARINFKLEVGAVTEMVEVMGVSPILQTENAVVGEVISGTTIVALPLNGRNFAQLALLIPGVQTHAPDTFNSVKTSGTSGRPYVNGQREQSNNFMLDGIDQNEAVDNLIAYYPSPDAIAEMRVETNNYSAEYGNVAGGVVAAITKSGTNEFHGSAFEFARDDRLDANSWANNRSGAEKGDFKQHIFGGTLGGPLAKNRLFFFVNYQGTRVDRPGPALAAVAPAEWRNGDFSSLSTPIIDPLTGRPFPGNRIPTSRFSPAARALLANTTNYPLPNRPGLTGNYVSESDSQTRNHQGDVKVDANLSNADNVSIRGSVGRYLTESIQTAFPLSIGSGATSDAESMAVNWSHIFGSTTVNELRVGYSHVTIDDNPGDNGLGNYNTALGIPGDQAIAGLSSITFGNAGIDGIGNSGIRHFTNNRTFQISEKLSLSRGRHFLSVGGQLLHYRMGQDYASNSGLLGTFAFNQNFTGNGFADFLLDQVGQKTVGRSGPWEQRQNRLGIFAQDDFKVNPQLTLNLGLRWEYASPISEVDDRQRNFDLETGQWVVPGEGDLGRGLTKAYYGGFSPRLGVAWTMNEKTVVRGGYGMVQYLEGTGANCRLPLNPPFFGEFTRSFAGGTPGSLSTGFADVNDQTNLQIRAWQTDLKPQLTQQWNLFVERQVTDTTSLNIGYVGSHSTRVVTFGNANQPLPGVGDPRTWAPEAQRRPFPQFGLIRYTASDGRTNYHGLQTSLRRRRANGLEFLASYTFSRALTDNGGFYGPGWGHQADSGAAGLGGDGNIDIRNKSLDYGPAWFSAAHTGALSGNYELPIGKGRSVGSNWSGVTDALLGGWNVSAILTVRSGLPVTVVNGWGNTSLQGGGIINLQRPDRVGDGSVSNPSWEQWLDRSAFREPALGTFGNSGVGILRGPGFYNIDMGIDKNFALGGARLLTLRIEAFNLLNHPNRGLPVRDITSEQFGQILTTANGARVLEFAAKLSFDDD